MQARIQGGEAARPCGGHLPLFQCPQGVARALHQVVFGEEQRVGRACAEVRVEQTTNGSSLQLIANNLPHVRVSTPEFYAF